MCVCFSGGFLSLTVGGLSSEVCSHFSFFCLHISTVKLKLEQLQDGSCNTVCLCVSVMMMMMTTLLPEAASRLLCPLTSRPSVLSALLNVVSSCFIRSVCSCRMRHVTVTPHELRLISCTTILYRYISKTRSRPFNLILMLVCQH